MKVVEENDLLAEKQESQNRDVPRKKKGIGALCVSNTW